MIVDKLRQTNFTETEKILADYILEHAEEVVSMTTRELAAVTFVSTTAIVRLCKKMGIPGFNQFKVQLSRELNGEYQKIFQVDVNFPFTDRDSKKGIVDKLANLSIRSIQAVKADLDYAVIAQFLQVIEKRKFIDIYGSGLSLTSTLGFAEKMTRIGYPTTAVEENSQQFYRAVCSTNFQTAIVVSYSGTTKTILKVIKALKERNIPTLLITGDPHSPMSRYATMVLSIHIDEELTMQQKIDSFASQMALHFLLDCIYSMAFVNRYAEHRDISIQATRQQFLFDK